METQNIEQLNITPVLDDNHGWVMDGNLVAQGYGVSSSNIRRHKNEHSDELIEGEHWFTGDRGQTVWTRLGVIKLGMFIRSPQAIAFREWASQVLESHIDSQGTQGLDNPILEEHCSQVTQPTQAPLNYALCSPHEAASDLLDQIREAREQWEAEVSAMVISGLQGLPNPVTNLESRFAHLTSFPGKRG